MVAPPAARRQIDLIVIHCSDTPDGRWTTVEDIDRWHAQRGFARLPRWRARTQPKLAAIGYHFVIYTTGPVVACRQLDEIGVHARGYNAGSVGICLIGRERFSEAQWASLAGCVGQLVERYPEARVVGHRDLDPAKTCPGFDVRAWLGRGMQPLAGHILEESALCSA